MKGTVPNGPQQAKATSCSGGGGRRGPALQNIAFIVRILISSALMLTLPMCTPRAKAGEAKSNANAAHLDFGNKQAQVFLSHCDYVKAQALLRTLVKEATRYYGPEDPKTLWQRHELAAAFLKAHDYQQAEVEFRSVWKLRTKVLGPKHADTLLSRFQLAVSLCSQHKHQEAETEYRAVLADEEQALGLTHAQTLQTDFRLAQCLQMQARFGDAKAFASRAYEGSKERFGETSVEFLTYRMLFRQLQDMNP
jgi:hypothetical protein